MIQPVPTSSVLESGDRLTRDEFERRYAASAVHKAELIRGVVYVASPVRSDVHGSPHLILSMWAGLFVARTPGTDGACDATVRLTPDSEPQPDIMLCIEERHGGRAQLDSSGYLGGPPELVVEIAASSASYDLHDKKAAYADAAIQEYVVWRTLDRAIDCFHLRDGRYERAPAATDGIWRSEVLPGLWLDCEAAIERDRTGVLDTLEQGLATEAHREFVAQLRAAAANDHG